MSIARQTFRFFRRLPLLSGVAEMIMREGRNFVWFLRPFDKNHSHEIPHAFLDFLIPELDAADSNFELLEIGAGDGRVLRYLANLYPDSDLTGIDLQKAAVAFGNAKIQSEGLGSRVRLLLDSCLSANASKACDYLASRTALIYLNDAEIRAFLHLYLSKVRRKLVLQEVVSTSGVMERSHYFAHPLAALIREIGGDAFDVTEQILDYPPWKGSAWTGANIVATRRGAPI